MEEKEKKRCGICRHYGALVNQGMWWCDAGHTDNMDAENCADYDDSMYGTMTTSCSSQTLTYNNSRTPQSNPMNPEKRKKARLKKKSRKKFVY